MKCDLLLPTKPYETKSTTYYQLMLVMKIISTWELVLLVRKPQTVNNLRFALGVSESHISESDISVQLVVFLMSRVHQILHISTK